MKKIYKNLYWLSFIGPLNYSVFASLDNLTDLEGSFETRNFSPKSLSRRNSLKIESLPNSIKVESSQESSSVIVAFPQDSQSLKNADDLYLNRENNISGNFNAISIDPIFWKLQELCEFFSEPIERNGFIEDLEELIENAVLFQERIEQNNRNIECIQNQDFSCNEGNTKNGWSIWKIGGNIFYRIPFYLYINTSWTYPSKLPFEGQCQWICFHVGIWGDKIISENDRKSQTNEDKIGPESLKVIRFIKEHNDYWETALRGRNLWNDAQGN